MPVNVVLVDGTVRSLALKYDADARPERKRREGQKKFYGKPSKGR